MTLASLPVPPTDMLHAAGLHVSLYAVSILIGITVAVLAAERRWRARGGSPGAVADVATWAIPAGLVGARFYHVLSSPQDYFGAGGSPLRALYLWQGGLSVWGAVAGGALGAWIACRRRGYSFTLLADSAAPAIAVAQAIGRWGCYFNQELYGRPTTLPWAVRIDPAHRPADTPDVATYQPTFLYESLWDLTVAGVVVWADRRFRLDRGRAFALYVALYTAGRAAIETLRIDPATHVLGLRLNVWTSLVLCAAAVAYLVVTRRRPGERDRTTTPDRQGTSGETVTPMADPTTATKSRQAPALPRPSDWQTEPPSPVRP